MPTFNVWIKAESFADLDADFVTRDDIEIRWTEDYALFMIVRA